MPLSFSLASEAMRDSVSELWRLCFGDPDDYIRFYLDNLFVPDQVLLGFKNGNPVAMLTMMPIHATAAGGRKLMGRYVFAVATHPDYQKQGISTALLDEAHRRRAADGADFSVLVPAGDELFSFYGKRGYGTAFFLDFKDYEAGDISPDSGPVLRQVTLESMNDVRGVFFAGSALYCGWPKDTLRRLDLECRYHGGGVWAFDYDGGTGYAVCYPAGDALHIKECVPSGAAKAVLPALKRVYQKEHYKVRLQAGVGEGRPFGMCRWYTEPADMKEGDAPYLSLVLD